MSMTKRHLLSLLKISQDHYLVLTNGRHTFINYSTSTIQSHNPPLSNRKLQTKRQQIALLLQSQPIIISEKSSLLGHYRKIHCQIVLWGFQYNVFLNNILLNMYSKSGGFSNSHQLFDRMPERNLISWSSMVSIYTHHGFNERAVMCFLEFRRSCSDCPSEYILASIIKACTKLSDYYHGDQLHCFVIKIGFDQDVYVGTSLIDFYAKNDRIDVARLLFDNLDSKSPVTWTTIITGYTRSGRSEVSLYMFKQIRESNVICDRYVLSSVLSACSMLEYLKGGKQIHAFVLRRETEMDLSVINVLLDLYVKCGRVNSGRKLFDQMETKNVISWTTMIAGYMQNSYHQEATNLFLKMARLGWKLEGYACTSILTSCGSLKALKYGRQVHCYSIKVNLEDDDYVKNGLIDMYSKCDSLIDARRVFNTMTNHNVVSYNAMIEGYSQEEKLLEALDVFWEMRLNSFSPSPLTFVSLLGLSASLFCLELSKQIHGLTVKYGFLLDIFAGSALIDVYSKCSCIRDARNVFEEIQEKDIVVWNALFYGYTLISENEEAFKLYSDLQSSELKPNEFTFAALITSASNLASIQQGKQFHTHIMKMGLESDPFVQNALVDMYSKCGSIEEAQNTFSSSLHKDIVCWNSMISTYANHGEAEKALQTFAKMLENNMSPNYITFVGVLSACSHNGLVDAGLYYFNSMSKFGVSPGTEHYACIVSLLGRAGKLTQALEFIEKMPIKPEGIVWRSLLGACRVVGNVELGIYAAEKAIQMDPFDSGSYVLLSNIFASKGRWGDVKRLREVMDLNRVVKEPGKSWIEVGNESRVFVARDKGCYEVDSVLDDLMVQIKGFGLEPDSL